MYVSRRHGFIAAIILCSPLIPRARAQSVSDGSIYAVLLDPLGRDVHSLTVTLAPAETGDGAERTAYADHDGTLLLPGVTPGTYVLRIGARTSAPFEVAPGGTTRLQLTLGLGGMTLSLRGPALAPEAAEPPDQDADGLRSLGGLASTQNTALLDGLGQTQAYTGTPVGTGGSAAPDPEGDSDSAELSSGPANGLARGRRSGARRLYAQGAVREFRVSTQNYSAQSSGAGALLSTISRSGGDRLHGSAFFTLRSQLFAATSPQAFATSYTGGVVVGAMVKPHDLHERFGLGLGGLVPRTGLHYFYSFEAQRRGYPVVSSPADPAFYSLTPIQRALLGNRGVSASRLNSALTYISSLTGLTPRRADQTIHFGRLDYTLHRQTLALEYNRVQWSSPAGLIDAPVVARGRASVGNASGTLGAGIVHLTSSFHRLTNSVRLGQVHDLQYERPQTPLAQEPAISPGGLSPEVNIGPNGLLFGTPAEVSQLAFPDEQQLELADYASLRVGRHLLQFGAQAASVSDRVANLANAAGTFRYDSGVTRGYAGGLVDFITDFTFSANSYPNGGCPSIYAATHLFCFRSFSQSFGAESTSFKTRALSAFVEDTWRPLRTLTLQAGARYELLQPPTPTAPNAALDSVFGAQASTSLIPADRNNLGPRGSLAWQPLGARAGTLRLGYGVFFGRVPGATLRAALAETGMPSTTTRIRITPAVSTLCPQVAAQGFGYPCVFPVRPAGVIANTTSSVTVFDRRFRLPTVQQASISFERTLPGVTVQLGYVLNLDRQLPTSTDLNIAPSQRSATYQLQGGTGAAGVRDGEIFLLPLYTARITPLAGPVTVLRSSVNATYHGLHLTVEGRAGSSLLLRASYAWSRAIDFGQALTGVPRTNSQLDPYQNRYDKGVSSLNYPWAAHSLVLWSPRVEATEPWVRALAAGWQAQAIVIARAGRPYSFNLSGGTALAGGHESLNGSGGALYLPTVGRNTLRLPPTAKVDLRLRKAIPAGAHLQFELLAEAYNVLNQRNISSVSQRAYLVGTPLNGVTPLLFQSAAIIAAEGLNTLPFGTPTSSATESARERQMELSLRARF